MMGCGQQIAEEKGKSSNEVLMEVERNAENVFLFIFGVNLRYINIKIY